MYYVYKPFTLRKGLQKVFYLDPCVEPFLNSSKMINEKSEPFGELWKVVHTVYGTKTIKVSRSGIRTLVPFENHRWAILWCSTSKRGLYVWRHLWDEHLFCIWELTKLKMTPYSLKIRQGKNTLGNSYFFLSFKVLPHIQSAASQWTWWYYTHTY